MFTSKKFNVKGSCYEYQLKDIQVDDRNTFACATLVRFDWGDTVAEVRPVTKGEAQSTPWIYNELARAVKGIII